MTTAAEALKLALQPLVPDWDIQFGHWRDPGKDGRSVVIKPAGGPGGDVVRRPLFTLSFIDRQGGNVQHAAAAVEAVVAALRARPSDDLLVAAEPGEPVYLTTSDTRPVFEVAVAAIN